VRVTVNGNSQNRWASITELRASGTEPASCGAASISGVTASGNDGNVPANVLDGNLATRWSSFGRGSWIQADLGSVASVCAVSIAWYRGDVRRSTFQVALSTDGSTFTTAFSGVSSGTATAAETYDVTDGPARYVRILVDGNTENDWASITELQVAAGSSSPTPAPDAGAPPADAGAPPLDASAPPAADAGSPPPTGAQFYVDPVSGSATGDGSAARPWRTLEEVVNARLIETRDQSGAVVNGGAPIKAGATVWLRSGYHGDVLIQRAFNTSAITIAAQAGHTPRLRRLRVQGAANWVVRGLSVSPSFVTPLAGVGDMVSASTSGTYGPTRDIVFDGLQVFSVADASGWSATDWNDFASTGIAESGDRIVIRNCTVRNVWYGIVSDGTNATVSRNLVENFAGDGMRGLGDGSTFEYNTVRNVYVVSGEHNDGFQSWTYGPGGVGTGVVRNVTLRGNRFQNWSDPAQPFRGELQGIGCFDGMFDGWVVENNVVITDHWHGIAFYGMLNSRVVNNTVLDIAPGAPGPAWILIAKHKDGRASQNVIVRNNLTDYGVSIDSGQVNITSDHNLQVGNPAAFFLDPARYDVHLRAGSPAIDTGVSASAPTIDLEGTPRPQRTAFDLGAYELR